MKDNRTPMQIEMNEKEWAALLMVTLSGEPPLPNDAYDHPANTAYFDAVTILGDLIARYRPWDVQERPSLKIV